MAKERRKNDQYFTPTGMTLKFLDTLEFPLSGKIFECCCGDGAISKELIARGHDVITNDIDTSLTADTHLDLAVPLNWMLVDNDIDFIITNPPYNNFAKSPLALAVGCIATPFRVSEIFSQN